MLIAKLTNEQELMDWLDRADRELASTRKLYRTLGSVGVADSQKAFQAESWHGDPWPQLSPATMAARDRAGNILHPTGQHILGTIGIIEVRDDYVRYGTPNPWAHVHNSGATLQGTAFGTITLPKRQFIGLHEEVVDEMLEGVGFWMETEVLGG